MSMEAWEELYAIGKECTRLREELMGLEQQFALLKEVVKEQGCPNWGEKAEGIFGPCDTCAYCRFYR